MSIDIGVDKAGTSLRMLISQALEKYPSKSLLAFLDDSNVVVRTAAARQLQVRGEVQTLEHAMRLAKSKKRREREIAAFILGQLGTPKLPFKARSVPTLIELCADGAHEVRAAALAALGHLQAIEADATIKRARRDANEDVRSMASFALRQLK